MVAVIVLNYKTKEETVKCVESIIAHTQDIEYEVFIVDNDSKDGSYEFLADKYEKNHKVMVFKTKKNEGYSAGNNYICKQLDTEKYDRICIVNSDVIFNNNALKLMSENISKDVAVTGPSVHDYNGNETQLLRKTYDFMLYMCSKKPLYYLRNRSNRFATEYPYTKDKFEFYGMLSGCCFMIDSKIFKRIGYFDENVFLYCEEWIIAYKLQKMHKKVGYIPEASVTHYNGKSTSKGGKGFQSLYLYISAFYYLRYYVKINIFERIYVYLQNTSVFILRSIADKTYRGELRKYIKYANKIFMSNDKIKIR